MSMKKDRALEGSSSSVAHLFKSVLRQPSFPRRPLRHGRKRRSMLNNSRASKRQSSQNNRNVLRRIEMRAGGARRDVPRRPRERRCKLSERRQLRAIRHSRLTRRRRARRHAMRKTGCETSASCALLARSTKRIESGRHFAKRSQTTKSPMTIQRLRANAESKRVVLSAGCGQLAPAIRGRNMRTVVP